MVAASSPVRRSGSMRNFAPSSSPTSRSAVVLVWCCWFLGEVLVKGVPGVLVVVLLAGLLVSLSLEFLVPWVPPVMRSVFSGTASLGVKALSVAESSSGGAASLPTLGISFAIVLVVLVRWGLYGLACW